ncbi:MAG TPA: response regulator transcription factor [Candidatus Tidjanibacter faecipullorum]|uniref:Response regulator transcription factor n=1 Tax=Candidatus Tidjanibacter faecipullorum TaxID=2838766 RepID=A0A9D2DE06_9BACT|nr:response regulator transcription factor [Candidatus Tidjanibacter faecipullorum]
MNAPKSYRILLADDHALFLSGLSGLLARRPECEVVGTAANGAECLELIRTVPHDVVLMDIDMPVMDGIEATERALAEHPDEKIITLSMHAEETFYFRMVEAGAKGFILKSADLDEVVAAIHVVCEGGSFFSQELLQHLVGSLKTSRHDQPEELLSDREKEILLLICKGLSNQEIGDRLFISKRTVDKHRANILEKTGCKNTANLVVWAIKNSVVAI